MFKSNSGENRSSKSDKQQKSSIRNDDNDKNSTPSSAIKKNINKTFSSIASSSTMTTTSGTKHKESNGTSSSINERRKCNKKKNTEDKAKVNRPIVSYLPRRLQNYVVHYHDDFFISPYFDPNLVIELMYEGFLPIATTSNASPRSGTPTHYLLPKLHEQRCVLYFSNLHVSKSPRRKSRDYILKVNSDFDGVVKGCHKQHGVAWLYPPMVQALKYIHLNNDYVKVKVYSIELYKKIPIEEEPEETKADEEKVDNEKMKKRKDESKSKKPTKYTYSLEAGELGYTVHNKIYTSLTGFYNQNGSGTIQLLALAGLLKSLNYELWDLGMEMEYKMKLGACCLDRDDFVNEFHKLRRRGTSNLQDRQGKNLDVAVKNDAGYEARELIDTFK